jgi:hypothetical protein
MLGTVRSDHVPVDDRKRGSIARRAATLALTAGVIVVLTATPALAVSSIDNDLAITSGDRYLSGGERVSWDAQATFGQYLFNNPYTSDFECQVSARHFERPQTFSASGTSPYWSYRAYEPDVRGAAYRSYSGITWVWQPRTLYNRFVTTVRSASYAPGWRMSRLGQHHWSVSVGAPAYEYTYHF